MRSFLCMRRAQQCRARRQSAAVLPSHAPHDSKARVQLVTTRRDSWRSHVHRTRLRSACSSSSYKLTMLGVEGNSPRPFSWGCKGDILFPRKRISPFAASPHGMGPEAALPRCTPCALRAQKETALAGCFPPAPEARKLSKLSIWDTYPHFPSFFFG